MLNINSKIITNSTQGKLSNILILSNSSFSISLKLRFASKQTSYFLILPYKHCYFLTLSAIFLYNLAMWFWHWMSCSLRIVFYWVFCWFKRKTVSLACFWCWSKAKVSSVSEISLSWHSSFSFWTFLSKEPK